MHIVYIIKETPKIESQEKAVDITSYIFPFIVIEVNKVICGLTP